MATIKHLSSKNSDLGAAERYLIFQHDESSNKPILDADGHLIPRKDYRIDSVLCGDEDFAIACMKTNLAYNKNLSRGDVKTHHYIISFDPRDAEENGLTMDQAQALGLEFCKKHFPGHQALVATHPDGHNKSGNIHVHIVINSLRIEDVPLLPHMDRPADTRAGCKHRCTDAALEYFKSEVMELCHREQLYQINLLHGSKERITEREYWAQKKGQLALDKENAALAAEGKAVKPTKFETDKAKLRQTIRAALEQAGSFDEFSALLLREGVTVKESRGRLSYLTPDRTKPITARRLGDAFDKPAVLAMLEQNAARATEQAAAISAYHPAAEAPAQRGKPAKNTPKQDGVQRMVDREKAREKGVGYDRWASLHNLKQLAATHNFLAEHDLLDLSRLDKAIDNCAEDFYEKRRVLKEMETRLDTLNDLRRELINYRKTRSVVDEGKKLSGKKAEAYRMAHEADYIIYEAARRRLKESYPGKKLPAMKELNAEIEALISRKNAAYNDYRGAKAEFDELRNVRDNARKLYRDSRGREKEQSHER